MTPDVPRLKLHPSRTDNLERLTLSSTDSDTTVREQDYSRHGFTPETAIQPPYALPKEWAGAWQSLVPEDTQPLTGRLSVPEYWQDPVLWGP